MRFAPLRLMAVLYRKYPVAATNYRATSGCGGIFRASERDLLLNRTLLEPRPKVSRARRHGTLSFKSYSFVTMGMIMGLLLVCLYR